MPEAAQAADKWRTRALLRTWRRLALAVAAIAVKHEMQQRGCGSSHSRTTQSILHKVQKAASLSAIILGHCRFAMETNLCWDQLRMQDGSDGGHWPGMGDRPSKANQAVKDDWKNDYRTCHSEEL